MYTLDMNYIIDYLSNIFKQHINRLRQFSKANEALL
jgi:hypothetical protein